MARIKDGNKFSGELHGQTWVASRAYEPHSRSKRGSKTPVVLNEPMAKSRSNTAPANQVGKVIKDAVDPFRKQMQDGTMWSRLLSNIKTQMNKAGTVDFMKLLHFEFHKHHQPFDLESVVAREGGVLNIDIQSKCRIALTKEKAEEYEQTIIVIFLTADMVASVASETVVFPLQPVMYREQKTSCDIPDSATTALVLIKGIFFDKGAEVGYTKKMGMRIQNVVKL